MKNLIFLVGILLSISINAQQFTAEQNFTGTVNGSVVVYDSNKDGFDNSFIFTGGKLAFSGSTVPLIGESWDITSGGFSSSQLTTSPGQHDVQIIFNVQNDDTTCDYLHFYADGSDGSVTPYQAPHVELKEEQVDGTYLIHENTGLPAMRIGQGFAYDVDSDKLMDIFINGEIMDTNGNYSYHAGWYKNNGDFTFTLEQTFTGLSAGTADIGNLDGLFGKDIIYTGVDNNASIRMIYLKHNGSGFDQIELDQTGGFTPIVLGSIAFGYNKDGDDFVDYIAITGATCCAAVAQLKKKTGTGFFTEDITPPFPGLYRSTLLFLESNSGLPNLYAHGRAADDTLHSDIFRNVDGSTFEQGFAFPGIELGFSS
jgi:hypothetical protein